MPVISHTLLPKHVTSTLLPKPKVISLIYLLAPSVIGHTLLPTQQRDGGYNLHFIAYKQSFGLSSENNEPLHSYWAH